MWIFSMLTSLSFAPDYEKFLTTARLEKMTRVHGGKFYAQSQQILSLSGRSLMCSSSSSPAHHDARR